jgi:hypothetical protein
MAQGDFVHADTESGWKIAMRGGLGKAECLFPDKFKLWGLYQQWWQSWILALTAWGGGYL